MPYAVRMIHHFQPKLETVVTGIDGVAIRLSQRLRPDKFYIGTRYRTGRQTGTAFNAIGKLKIFFQLIGCLVQLTLRIHFNLFVFSKNVRSNIGMFFDQRRQIGDHIPQYRVVCQRFNHNLFRPQFGNNLSLTGQARFSINLHGTGTADSHSTGSPVGNGTIQILLNVHHGIQHRPALYNRNGEGIEMRLRVHIGFVAKYFKNNIFCLGKVCFIAISCSTHSSFLLSVCEHEAGNDDIAAINGQSQTKQENRPTDHYFTGF
ncbi:hypothetical protein BMS3Abin05_02395 [bacterium BMS3Abin05]|nr:hypothetical protein BMS3Abin05_02395 [bacterium BMS3Abin05]